MGRVALAVVLALGLSGCGLLGDPMTDPDTGEVVPSPAEAVVEGLVEGAAEHAIPVATDLMDDGELSDEQKMALGGAALLALLGGLQAYRKRREIRAKLGLGSKE